MSRLYPAPCRATSCACAQGSRVFLVTGWNTLWSRCWVGVLFLASLLSVAVFPAPASALAASSRAPVLLLRPAPCPPLGDLTGDGLITTDDTVAINDILSSVRIPTEAQVFEADVNGDGKITATDSAEIAAYRDGSITTFSGCVPFAPVLARAERDARRLADLSLIAKALARYSRDTGTLPTYLLIGTPSSDANWKSNSASSDFRKRLRPYLYPLPVDPLNSQLEHYRYVYAALPASRSEWGTCAGKTILYVARVETSIAGHEECDMGDGKNHFTRVIVYPKAAVADDFFASAFLSLWRLFSPKGPAQELF